MTETTIIGIIADGLDALTDGRGWGPKHTAAKNLANAAPDLLEALEFLTEAAKTEPGMAIYKAHIKQAQNAIAKAKGE